MILRRLIYLAHFLQRTITDQSMKMIGAVSTGPEDPVELERCVRKNASRESHG